VVLDNFRLCLNEDRPSANITSPGPIPKHLEVAELIINRGLDGVFHIKPPGDLTVNCICSYHVRFDFLMMADMKTIFLLDVICRRGEVSLILKVDAADSFKALVIIYRSTQCHIPENSNLCEPY
jgi:hypothetical protein